MVAVGPGRGAGHVEPAGSAPGRRPRTFVPVESMAPAAHAATQAAPEEPSADRTTTDGALAQASGTTTDGALAQASGISPAPGTPGRIPGTWWLWGDPEPWPDL